MLWFNRRLGSLLLAIPMGVAFTLLASLVFYRWQHRRWLKRKSALNRQALSLWLADELLSGYNRGAARTGLRSSVQPAGLSSLL